MALLTLLLLTTAALAQNFDVASIKPAQPVGPDYNNQLTYSPNGLTARNATLRRLIAESWHLQLNQVLGPNWLDQNEYDLTARAATTVSKDQLTLMLRTLVDDRFHLKHHSESRDLRHYELVVDKAGPKIQPVSDTEPPKPGGGFHFRGDMRQFADLLAVQLSIPAVNDPTQPARASGPPLPVLDKSGLAGIYDFTADIRPELGTDMFTQWQRALAEQLGLRLTSRKGPVEVLVVDDVAKTPTEN